MQNKTIYIGKLLYWCGRIWCDYSYRIDDSYFSFAKDLLERGLKMAIKSYDVKYLDSVATNIGTMFEYAVACGYELKVYWDMFTCSTVTKQIENGNLKFLVCYFRNWFIKPSCKWNYIKY